MVSLDNAVIARLERHGKRFEILVDPDLVDRWKEDHSSVPLGDLLAVEDVFHDSRDGERPTAELLRKCFESTDITLISEWILEKGSIQLTSAQRKEMVDTKRRQIISHVQANAIDPKSRLPHPRTRIEHALNETRYAIDPFKRVDEQIKEVVALLKPLIPLSFETLRLAFKVAGAHYGSTARELREYVQKEEWLADGTWACVVEIPAGMKGDVISIVMRRDSEAEVREL